MSDEILVGLVNRLKPLKLDTDLQEIRDLTTQLITLKFGVVPPVRKKLTRLQELIFECSTRTDSACWEWKGAKTVGYGKLGMGGGKAGLAHHVAYEIFEGPIPVGKWVLHDCDNRKCFNPSHLFLGTQKDNMRDWYNKGKGPVGSGHSNARLDENKVRVILRLHRSGTTMNELARMFGVCRKTIQRIIWNLAWKHVKRISREAVRQVRRAYTKLNVDKVREIRRSYALGISIRALAQMFDVHCRTIEYIISRKTWKQVSAN